MRGLNLEPKLHCMFKAPKLDFKFLLEPFPNSCAIWFSFNPIVSVPFVPIISFAVLPIFVFLLHLNCQEKTHPPLLQMSYSINYLLCSMSALCARRSITTPKDFLSYGTFLDTRCKSKFQDTRCKLKLPLILFLLFQFIDPCPPSMKSLKISDLSSVNYKH